MGGNAQNPVRFDLGYTNFASKGSLNAELIEAIKEQDQLAERQQREIERLKMAVKMSDSQ